MNSINQWVKAVHTLAIEKGWWDGEEFPISNTLAAKKLLLIHSEVSEAVECLRVGNYDAPLCGVVCLDASKDPYKPEGFASELADVVIRCMDLARACDIDLESVIEQKHEFNKIRPQRHGNKLF